MGWDFQLVHCQQVSPASLSPASTCQVCCRKQGLPPNHGASAAGGFQQQASRTPAEVRPGLLLFLARRKDLGVLSGSCHVQC